VCIVASEETGQPSGPEAEREEGHQESSRGESGDEDRRQPRGRAREEQGDREDRSELADGACGQDEHSEGGAELTGIAEDRHQRPERSRREGDADIQDRNCGSACFQRAGNPEGERDRKQPARSRESQWPSADAWKVDLEPGQEEQERKPDLAQEVDQIVWLDEVENVRADDDSRPTSPTTTGRRSRAGRSATSGARTATTLMMTRALRSAVISS
jgi:hypothetical protein